MSDKVFWNGEEVDAERGTGVMIDSPEFPMSWGREQGLIGQRVPVVKVRMRNGDRTPFFLWNKDNEGWKKVTEGRGMWTYLDVEKYVPDEVG